MVSEMLTMMLVDQGLLSLEDTPDKFLPPLRGAKTRRPITIRRVCNHTNGISWQWGDRANDMEEYVGTMFPFDDVGDCHHCNVHGAGMQRARAGRWRTP